jgi:retron-type reverse transcriptase
MAKSRIYQPECLFLNRHRHSHSPGWHYKSSPLLANIALDGIEKEIGFKFRIRKSSLSALGYRITIDDYIPKDKRISIIDAITVFKPYVKPSESSEFANSISFGRYADDFLVLCESESDAIIARSKLTDI